MKKMIFLLLSITLSGVWLAWKPETSSRKIPNAADIISCMESEAVQEYIKESGEWSFAALHPSPKSLKNWHAQGKRITFPAADGKDAQGYYIAPKKKSNKWLIVIQEWWGLNEQIMAEADKYANELGDFNVLAVDLYDGKVAATPDSAMKYSRSSDPARIATIIKAAISNAGKNAGIYSVGWCFGGCGACKLQYLPAIRPKAPSCSTEDRKLTLKNSNLFNVM
jgi:carboxymethylenebutenolidase